jgi:hypothetical protein
VRIPLKQFLAEQVQTPARNSPRKGIKAISTHAVYTRYRRSGFAGLKLERINKRVVFVVPGRPQGRPSKTGLSNKALGHTKYMRLWRKQK